MGQKANSKREWCECHSELHLVTTPPTRSTAALRAEGLRSLLARVILGLHRPPLEQAHLVLSKAGTPESSGLASVGATSGRERH